MNAAPPRSTLFPHPTPFRSAELDPDAPAVNSHYLDAVARLAPGVSIAAAQAEAARLTSRLPERSEEHTSELQSRQYLVCRLLLEKKKYNYILHYLHVPLCDI